MFYDFLVGRVIALEDFLVNGLTSERVNRLTG